MNVEYISVNALIPYERNTKIHDEKQINNIAESIDKYGFVQPLVIDKDNVVVIGHGRLLAAKKLKMKEVPCVCVDDLTEEQVKALRIVDNKTALDTGFDFDVLPDELSELDLSDFDFDFGIDTFEFESETEETEYEDKENPREQTFRKYNLEYNDLDRVAGKYQMPIVRKTIIEAPKKPCMGFHEIMDKARDENRAVHMFVDDYKIERLWNQPERYIEKLSTAECVFTPDYSLYLDMPIAMQIWNTYRNRLVGQILQDNGVTVLPTIGWSYPESFDFCFDGIEEGSICVISTIGVKRDEEALKIWHDGVDEMIKRIKPSAIWVYGGEIEHDYKGIKVEYLSSQGEQRIKESREVE